MKKTTKSNSTKSTKTNPIAQEVTKVESTPIDTTDNYLLNNCDSLITRDEKYVPSGNGCMPKNRPIRQYIDYGVVTIDKPANPSSHEVVTWAKTILADVGCDKTGHSGTLDPNVTGVLTVCLNRSTRLAKMQQSMGKRYVCVVKFEKEVEESRFDKAVELLTGHLLQRPPLLCAVKRELRLRWIYKIEKLEFTGDRGLFIVDCEAGSYIRTLCTHMGLFCGVPAEMETLRRIRSGNSDESECVTLHDLMDAAYIYKTNKDETYLRKLIKPLESLLVSYKKIIVKDTAVASVCAGANLSIQGVFKYDETMDTTDTVVIMTSKGEAVAIGTPMVCGAEMKGMIQGFVCKPKRVIMEEGTYPRCWGIMTEYEIYSEEKETLLESKVNK